TKGDIATEPEFEATLGWVARLNHVSPVLRRHGSQVPMHELLGLSACHDSTREDPYSWLRRTHEHVHTHGIASYVFHDFRIESWETYAEWLAALRRIDADRLLRTKGLVRLEDGHLHVVQGVRHVFSAPIRYEGP